MVSGATLYLSAVLSKLRLSASTKLVNGKFTPSTRLLEVRENARNQEKSEHLVNVVVMVSLWPISRRHLAQNESVLVEGISYLGVQFRSHKLAVKQTIVSNIPGIEHSDSYLK